MSGTEFGKASAPTKQLSDFDEADVAQAIAAVSLWSEELTTAARKVKAQGNPKLEGAFFAVVEELLSGEYKKQGGRGFDVRDALGHAVKDMLADKPDMGRFSRLLHNTDNKIGIVLNGVIHDDEKLMAKLETLQARLELHAEKQDKTIHDGYDPKTRNLTLAHEM